MADHCVRSGATGANNGTDWDNAYTDLPATLTRGDTYFVADGTYGNYVFDDAVSGSNYIYVKKATETAHGPVGGWSSAYGDGIATWSGTSDGTATWRIATGYYDIDGMVGSNMSGYGFVVVKPYYGAATQVISTNSGNSNKIGVVLRHLEVKQSGYSYPKPCDHDCLYMVRSGGYYCDSWIVEDCWLHNANRVHVYTINAQNCTWNRCFFTENYNYDNFTTGDPPVNNSIHGESFTIWGTFANNSSQNNTIKNSVFRNSEGTGVIVFQDTSVGGWKIHGNVFYTDVNHILDGWFGGPEPSVGDFNSSNGIICDTGTNSTSNIQIYNNTFVNCYSNTNVFDFNAGHSNIVARNNIFCNCTHVSMINADVESDNTLDAATSIFTDYSSNDFTLSSGIAGYTLDTEYETDMNGTTRGSDTVWDRGAFEFNTGVPPSSLVNDGSRRYWRIKAKNDLGAETPWSAPSYFEMAIVGYGTHRKTGAYNQTGGGSYAQNAGGTNLFTGHIRQTGGGSGATGVVAAGGGGRQRRVFIGVGVGV